MDQILRVRVPTEIRMIIVVIMIAHGETKTKTIIDLSEIVTDTIEIVAVADVIPTAQVVVLLPIITPGLLLAHRATAREICTKFGHNVPSSPMLSPKSPVPQHTSSMCNGKEK